MERHRVSQCPYVGFGIAHGSSEKAKDLTPTFLRATHVLGLGARKGPVKAGSLRIGYSREFMRSKISLKWSVIILGVTGIIFSSAIIFVAKDFYANSIAPMNKLIPQDLRQIRSALPVRLLIPKINVDAAIEYVGLTSRGAMAVPAGPADVGWFDLGPRPGEDGSAVIDGHEGWKDGIRAVFDDLYKLRVGDKVYIEDEQNVTTTFVVSRIQTYEQNGDASSVFGSSDGKSYLNLITCEGTWNTAQKNYSNRLVVFTEAEPK
jgi:LPXTG-site transpeptidase (sortase) family protein